MLSDLVGRAGVARGGLVGSAWDGDGRKSVGL